MRLLHNEQSMTYRRVTIIITPSNQLTCQYREFYIIRPYFKVIEL